MLMSKLFHPLSYGENKTNFRIIKFNMKRRFLENQARWIPDHDV